MSFDQFVELHAALLVKHARAHAAHTPDSLAPEDLVAELARVLEGVESSGVDLFAIPSPDGYLRAAMPLVGRRAKRRRTLLEQITSGDDVDAVSADLAALEAELPPAPAPTSAAARDARARLDAVHAGLSPRDALAFALCFEDDRQLEGAASALTTATEDLAASRARALTLVRELRTFGESARHASDEELGQLLTTLAREAADPACSPKHLDDPLIALVRSGDPSDDLADAVSHVAKCVDCRARVAEGEATHRAVVVMAIDAGANATAAFLAKAAEGSHARLVDRGGGRYTAVLEADNLSDFKAKLTAGGVARVAVAGQVELPIARRRAASLVDPTEAGGTDGAELKAWSDIAKVQVARPPARPPTADGPASRPHVGVVLAALAALAALAIGVAVLASH
ncbi:MAG: hypothetical protein IPF92_02355 [Myxococcales bacterium]|nr:hypothetical protein [Myxococcales bacterium]MBL0193970.1 hypothetical protein [Myxococcales bacterium]HQY62040.1 hypothetical protein [Polyangiaceae bacterium]